MPCKRCSFVAHLMSSLLSHSIFRYQFFQQCKADILSGSLPCLDDLMAVELAAYALQCKFSSAISLVIWMTVTSE